MQVGKVFALAEHPTLMPAEPMKQMMMCCAGVEVYEMILRTAEYDGQDVSTMRQDLTWSAKAKTSMHLLMGFDSIADPDRGTAVETVVAQYAIMWWMGGGTVNQTPQVHYFDWTFTAPQALHYILWRHHNQWAPAQGVSTRWEHKSASIYYKINASGGGHHYTYVRVMFYFEPTQIQRIVAGDIHYVVLSFLDRKTARVRSLVVHGARLAATYVSGTPNFRNAQRRLIIDGTQLPANPLRVSSTGQLMTPCYAPGVVPPTENEASRMPVLPCDFNRIIDRCLGGPGVRGAYAGPFACAELGEIRGRTLQQLPLVYLTRLLLQLRRARRRLAARAAAAATAAAPAAP